MKTIKGYKFIQSDMKSKNGNHKWEIGKWYKEERIKLAECGFHACLEPTEALAFIYGDKFFIVEARGEIVHDKGTKFVASEMRLVREIPNIVFKRFAIWCAKQCLPIYEKEFPDDSRVRDCINAAEEFLDGKISLNELEKARSVGSACSVGSAAYSAAYSADSAVRSAVRSAARLVARSADSSAYSVARSAGSACSVWSAARSAQNKEIRRLIGEYVRTTSNKIKRLKKLTKQ